MTSTPPVAPQESAAPHKDAPSAISVEQFGIAPIPDADRTAGPLDLFRLAFGGANTIATVVLGTYPVLFGLGFVDGLLAIVSGLVLGALVLMPMSLFGPRTGTSNSVASSAHLGVHGRIVGSFLSLLTAIAFFSISVWTAGDLLVGGFAMSIGVEPNDGMLAGAYALFAIIVLVVCIYGFRFMLLVNKVAVIAASVLFLVGIVAFWDAFDPSYAGMFGEGADEETAALFWPAFVGAALVAMSNPISFGAFLGDWARYIPRETPGRRVLLATFLAQAATIVPFVFGLTTATIVATVTPDLLAEGGYMSGLLQISPAWYVLPLCFIALIGGLSTGTTALYGTGLDFSSVFPRFSRVQSTILIGIAAIAIIFIGRFAFNIVQSISTFAVLIVTCTAPWMIIMTVGWIVRRGWYDSDSLQVFNRKQVGGRYWFARGWNWRAMSAWIIAMIVGVLFVNLPGQFVGWFGGLMGGIDFSIPFGLGTALVLYLALLWAFPEPRDAFGPEGSRLVPTGPAANTPITDEAK